jgi:hypothetical protein
VSSELLQRALPRYNPEAVTCNDTPVTKLYCKAVRNGAKHPYPEHRDTTWSLVPGQQRTRSVSKRE